ncbi:leucine-rich repeat-containing protein 43 [Enhydra lutris kenyoni]|uniref:Leucine-rich repeat-containing protein 43 n=1 Tax=Enhydra lutris kenyoni TaxID=391180 RepID=A0A2Y9KUE3_ENHLU|nr:leucine-rich repeat-containing protein 43 [Enhydra lutris kenyoni]
MQKPGGTLSAAVREHLRRLCLREFPCGTGSWNKSRFLPRTWRTWKELVPREEEAGNPGEETVEALLGLVRSPNSPWALPEGSSAEDHFLKELAIRNPLVLKDTFFYSYFRSLRVVDKQVSLVDKGLLKFLKLEELVLSANQIKEIDAINLPPTLKVLELYGNKISSVECLCTRPPPHLQHLGLGHNKLLGPLESLYVTADYWPNLVSLDLSFNDLTDLQGLIASLRTLPHLRVLVLQGNPLALVPYYRGFTIDSLPPLCVLDDITVSPSEKHQFRGLSRSGDLLAREAQLVVTIGNVKGILDTSILDPEPGPQGPFISYSYYVTYDFVEDEEGERSAHGGVLAEIVKPSPSTEQLGEDIPEELFGEAEDSPESGLSSQSGELEESGASEGSGHLPRVTDSAEELAKLRPRIDPRLCPSPGTVLFSTVRKPWTDVIPCHYEMHHTLRDLVPLKAFLLAGTTVTIVEEKILSWPPVPSPVDAVLSSKSGKGEKDKGQKDKDKKGKDRKDKAGKGEKETVPKEQKASKKKELPKELRQDPPILRVLGSGLVALEPLLVGEPLVSEVCNFGVIRTLETDNLIALRDAKKNKNKKAKKEKNKSAVHMDDGDYQPQPLTVEVQVQLNQYRSAEEALREMSL